MRWPLVRAIAGKELLSTLRDRRALISNLLIPVLLVPVMLLGLPLVLGGLFEREQSQLTPLALEGAEHLPDALRAALESQNVEIVETGDALTVIRGDEAPVGLIVPAGLMAELEAGRPPTLRLLRKVGNLQSDLAASKVGQAIEGFRRALVAERLRASGLDPALLEPLRVETLDASRPEERGGGQLAWMIPFFIAVWTLTGGQMTALDATAGEKERGTLEALLVAPVRRSEVVAGKFLATLASGLSAATMAIVGVLVAGVLLSWLFLPRLGDTASEMVAQLGGIPTIRIEGAWILLGSAVLLAAAVAALLIAVALFARSFKEAQTYVAPLSLLLIFPALALQFSDLLDLGRAIYAVPLMNVMVLIDDVLGGSAELGDVLLAWSTMVVLIAALLAFALRTFQREGVIFRT